MRRFLYIYAGMIVVAAVLARLGGCPPLFRLPPTAGLLWGSLAVAVVLALAVVEAGKRLEDVPWYRKMAEYLRLVLTSPELLGPSLDGEKAFVVAVYSSVGEEALFRGFVQPFIMQKIAAGMGAPGFVPAALAIVITSLIFGIMHFPMVKELRPWTVFALVAGVLFGALAAWSESLLPPVVAHLLINWLNLRRLAALRPSGTPV
jgi:membrane protease YdiL (CAAX protease family)